MLKKIISIILGSLILAAFVGNASNAQCAKHRKIALHGYVYAKTKTLEDTVKEAKKLGADGVVCSASQRIAERFGDAKFSHKMTAQQRKFVKELFAGNGIDMVSFGIWDLKKGESAETYLAFCAEMGIEVFTWEGDFSKIQQWQNAAKKYNMKVAIHNHERNLQKRPDYNYWNPKFVSDLIKDKPNIYACADNGHWCRSGINPSDGYKTLKGKLAAIHFKDPKDLSSKNKCEAPLGEGALNLAQCLLILDESGYDGYYVLENEQVFDNPTPAMVKSISYLRTH